MKCNWSDVKPTVEGVVEVDCDQEATMQVEVFTSWAHLVDHVCSDHAVKLLADARENGWVSEYERLTLT